MSFQYIETKEPWERSDRIEGFRYTLKHLLGLSSSKLSALGLEPIPAPEPDNSPPPRRTVGTFREFMDLFTPSEQVAIVTAAKQDVTLELWLLRAQGGEVPLDHQGTVDGVGALLAGGLITQAAHDAVLAADYNDGPTDRSDA